MLRYICTRKSETQLQVNILNLRNLDKPSLSK